MRTAAVPLVLASNAPPEGPPPDGISAPRLDFLEISAALKATICYPPARGRSGGGGIWTQLEDKTASDWRQAVTAVRRHKNASLYLSLSEKVGLPLALLAQRSRGGGAVPHVLIAHNLTSAKKRAFQKRTGYLRRFDQIIVLCRTQEEYLLQEAGLPPERVHFVYDKVDHAFWSPGPPTAESGKGGYILSVGRERRDYAALVEAVRPCPDWPTIIVASSPWSRQAGGGDGAAGLPAQVTFRRGLSYQELRQLYAGAAAVVVPLQKGTEYAAGVNAVLEAQAMRKALIVTETPGIRDYVEAGQNARLTSAADPDGLRAAIQQTLQGGEAADRLAAQGRRVVEEGRNLDTYVRTVTDIARKAAMRP